MSRPTYEELERLAERLQTDAAKHLHTQQELINAKASLDVELERFRAIHEFVQQSLRVEDLQEFCQLTLESIIGAFEFEVSLFLGFAEDGDGLEVMDQFGLFEAPARLPWEPDWLDGDALVCGGEHAMIEAWSELGLAFAIASPWLGQDGRPRGLIVGGITEDSADFYDPIGPEHRSAFALMARQAGSLWAQKEADAHMAALKRSYSRFVPFEFLQLLGRDSIEEIGIGDQVELEMTVLFSDLRGFSRVSEELSPEEVFALLNRYLAEMEPQIRAAGGFINQFQGDAIMALFPDHCSDTGMQAGIAMHQALNAFNAERVTAGAKPLAAGIGLHCGPLMLGAIGGELRMDSNVVGDTANLAARIEGTTKIYGSRMVISDETVARSSQDCPFQFREIDRVVVQGRVEPVTLYEVLDADPARLREHKLAFADRFARALGLYREGEFREARLLFMRCMLDAPDDGPANLFVDRCGELARNPPYYWNGVTVLDRK